jgi:hypothetical protein
VNDDNLTTEQRARCAAFRAARELATSDQLVAPSFTDMGDLLDLAEYIRSGRRGLPIPEPAPNVRVGDFPSMVSVSTGGGPR